MTTPTVHPESTSSPATSISATEPIGVCTTQTVEGTSLRCVCREHCTSCTYINDSPGQCRSCADGYTRFRGHCLENCPTGHRAKVSRDSGLECIPIKGSDVSGLTTPADGLLCPSFTTCRCNKVAEEVWSYLANGCPESCMCKVPPVTLPPILSLRCCPAVAVSFNVSSTWTSRACNQQYEFPCPGESTGMVSRFCTSGGVWGGEDFTNCKRFVTPNPALDFSGYYALGPD